MPPTNCLSWAIAQLRRYGGYVCFRYSDHWFGRFHCLWIPPGKFPIEGASYSPPARPPWRWLPWRFKGSVVPGDPDAPRK